MHRPILETRPAVTPDLPDQPDQPVGLRLTLADEAATQALAEALAGVLRAEAGPAPAGLDAHLDLRGDLGAGKTTFTRHLLRALGVSGRIKSPTYAVHETYALPGLAVSHFDFYRMSDAREADDAGFRDVFGAPGLKITEWAERVSAALPEPDLRLTLTADDTAREPAGVDPAHDARTLQIEALSPRGARWLAALDAARTGHG